MTPLPLSPPQTEQVNSHLPTVSFPADALSHCCGSILPGLTPPEEEELENGAEVFLGLMLEVLSGSHDVNCAFRPGMSGDHPCLGPRVGRQTRWISAHLSLSVPPLASSDPQVKRQGGQALCLLSVGVGWSRPKPEAVLFAFRKEDPDGEPQTPVP